MKKIYLYCIYTLKDMHTAHLKEFDARACVSVCAVVCEKVKRIFQNCCHMRTFIGISNFIGYN